jgi:hypothetical protein
MIWIAAGAWSITMVGAVRALWKVMRPPALSAR